MGGHQRMPRRSQGSSRCEGVVSGYVLKIIRESIRLTQSELAECIGVDTTTVQAWESGRRPVTALKTGDLARLRIKLTRLGARPRLFDVLADAIEADLVIADVVSADAHPIDPGQHPLAASVHRRALMSLLTWPLTGSLPAQLTDVRQIPATRRGPVADKPVLASDDRTRFFDHLLLTADKHRDDDHALLRRQAIYLLGFDERTETTEWLATEQRRAVRSVGHADDVPSWVAVRSSAVALALSGNNDPLCAFVTCGLTNETQDVANLNYWAYWVGEFPEGHTDDTFMITTRPETWSGTRLLPHLLSRLRSSSEQAELYVHTLWTLLATHPGLLVHDPSVRVTAQGAIDEVSAESELTRRARQELASVAYAIRLAHR